MNLITRDDLKTKLDHGEHFKLVLALGEWAFRAKRIPGSLRFTTPEQGLELLDASDDIVVYCSDEACAASRYAYLYLTENGFLKVRRYAGGLADWEDAGYPLEGEMVE